MGAEAPAGGIADPHAEPLALWSPRQRRFTKIVAISGVGAWIAYHVALSLCDPWALGTDVELSIFALVGQAIQLVGYLAVANVAYDLARLAGRWMGPRQAGRFRRLAYVLGVTVCAALPWYVPADAAVFCLTTHVPPPEALAPPAASPPLS
ncbi:MAG TPA: hypothetical protein VF092_15570 [Longimicrobium sp.]